MNPLTVFDHIYYKIAYYYRDIFVLEHQKEFAGVLFLSLIQIISINALIMPIFSIRLTNILNITGYLILIALNFTRYKKIITYSELNEKWRTVDSLSKLIKNSLAITYIVLSFLILVVLTT